MLKMEVDPLEVEAVENEVDLDDSPEYVSMSPRTQPRKTVRTRPCAVPIVRVDACLTHPSSECNEKIEKLAARVELLEDNCRLLRRRVRALEMERTEDIRNTVLEVLNNQKLTISTSFIDHDDQPGSRQIPNRGKAVIRTSDVKRYNGHANVSSSEDEVPSKSASGQSRTSTFTHSSSTVGLPEKKRTKPRVIKSAPVPVPKTDYRSRAVRKAYADSIDIAGEIEIAGEEEIEYQEQVILASPEDDNPEIISEGDVAVIMEDYDDPDYVDESEKLPATPPESKPRGRWKFDLSKRSEEYKRLYHSKKRRERMMLDAKKYVCNDCNGRTFKTSWELKRHCRIHNDELAYRCRICPDKTYTQPHNLTKHMRGFHQQKDYQLPRECRTR